ncbi:hypothetical protein Tco_0269043 [Tanacetum coccineum]
MYGALIPNEMINQDTKDSKAYKTYLEFATGKATPKKVLSSETLLVCLCRRRKAPTKVDRGKGMDLLFEAVLLEVAQLKKTLKKSKLETHKLYASGLGDGVGSQPKSESENKSWGNSEDDDSNDDDNDDVTNDDDDINGDSNDDGDNEGSDSEKIDSNKDENLNLNQNDDEEEEYEEEYVCNPDNYEFTNDDEEYEELYKDVNVRLRDVEHGEEGKKDAEKTIAGHDADNPSPADTEMNSMMNIDVRHEEPSTQTPPLLTIPVTVILETSTAAAPTIPLTIPSITYLPQ